MIPVHAALLIAPELTLFATAILTLLIDKGAGAGAGEGRLRPVTVVGLLGLAVAFLLTLRSFDTGAAEIFSRSLSIDPVTQYFKIILIFAGTITTLQSSMSREVEPSEKGEMTSLILLGTLAMCVMASAVHFLLLFLAYVVTGVTCFILAAMKRRSELSSEVGVKFFMHAALTMFLFAIGIVMLYGIGKSFNIMDIRAQLAKSAVPVGYLWVVFGLIFIALAAQLAAFPFHFLAPDIVEGSPAPVSSFFTVSSMIAAMAFALRLCIHIFSVKGELKWDPLKDFEWPDLVAGVAAVTMTIGNLTALYQTNLKRLIGYACMAQMGYILMGVAIANHSGISAVLFSLASYALVTLGSFFVIQLVTDSAGSEKITILRGLVWRSPYQGVALCIFLLSLAGLPPLVGFVERFYVLGAVVHEKLYWLSIVAAINWVLGLSYCLTMIRQVFAPNDAGTQATPVHPLAHVALALLLLPTLALGIYWDPLMNYITKSLEVVAW